MVYSHWLYHGDMDWDLDEWLYNFFASDQELELKQGQGRMGCIPNFQVLKLFGWCVLSPTLLELDLPWLVRAGVLLSRE